MSGHEKHATWIVVKNLELRLAVVHLVIHCLKKCIDHRVTRDDNAASVDAFGDKIATTAQGRGEMQRRQPRRQLPIDLLGKGCIAIVSPESSLQMDNWNAAVETGKGTRERRRCVALHKQGVRPDFLAQSAQTFERSTRDTGPGLAILQDREAVFG